MNIVFRVDGSADIGLGHIMRCITLAKQLVKQHSVSFLSCALPRQVELLLIASGVTLLTTKNIDTSVSAKKSCSEGTLQAFDQIEHANVCKGIVENTIQTHVDLLIVDHYQLSAPFCHAMRTQCSHIMVIDDLANRTHDCDILLDQNYYDDFETRYNNLVPEGAYTLLGPKYALLREEFYRPLTKARCDNHFIVCFGGSDPANMTERVVDILLSLKANHFTADIVVGAAYLQLSQLKEKLANQKNMTLYHDTPFLTTLMQKANFMVGAGGSMHWERAKLSVTGLIVTLAQNQVATTRCLHEKECCLYIGESQNVTSGEIRKAIEFALNSPEKIREIADNAHFLVGEHQAPSFVADEILKVITRYT